MNIKISTKKINKNAFTSEPTPESVKENVSKLESVIIKEVSGFKTFSHDQKEFKKILAEINDDLSTIRPILEYVSNVDNNNVQRAFKEQNIKDTFDKYTELKNIIFPEKQAAATDPMAGSDLNMPKDFSEDAGGEADTLEGDDQLDLSNVEEDLTGEATEAAISSLRMIKRSFDEMSSAPLGLSDKIEKLYFLGRIDNLGEIKNKVNRAIKIGELLLKAINNEGRPTIDAVNDLNAECGKAIAEINAIQSAVDAMASLPDRLENISDLLNSSLLVRIEEIKGSN